MTKSQILDEFLTIREDGSKRVNANKTKESWLTKHPIIKSWLEQVYPDSKSISEKLYRISHNIEEVPKCKWCGKDVTYRNFQEGYPACCCHDHAMKYVSTNVSSIKETHEIVNDQMIIDFLTSKKGHINNYRTREKALKEHGYYDYIVNRFQDTNNVRESIYMIVNNLTEKPKCASCGGPVTLRDYKYGFHEFCSMTCQSKSKNHSKNIKIYKKEEITDSIIKEEFIGSGPGKWKENWLKKRNLLGYVNDRYDDSTSFKESIYRILNDIEEKPKCKICGKPVEFYRHQFLDHCQRPECKEKAYALTYTNIFLDWAKRHNIDCKISQEDNSKVLVYNQCQDHNPYEIYRNDLKRYVKYGYITKNKTFCPICHKNHITGIESAIKQILDHLRVKHIDNYREVVANKELDLYLPDYKIGIECNGTWWHRGKEAKKKLQDQTNICLRNGIRPVTLWEYDINNSFSNVEAFIERITKKSWVINYSDCSLIEDNKGIDFVGFYNTDNLSKALVNEEYTNIFSLIYKDNRGMIFTCKKKKGKKWIIEKWIKKGIDIQDINYEEIFLTLKVLLKASSIEMYINLDLEDLDDYKCLRIVKIERVKQTERYFINDIEYSKEEAKALEDTSRLCDCWCSARFRIHI